MIKKLCQGYEKSLKCFALERYWSVWFRRCRREIKTPNTHLASVTNARGAYGSLVVLFISLAEAGGWPGKSRQRKKRFVKGKKKK